MLRALLDTNVVLDFLLDRPPFAEASAAVWEANKQKRFVAYISAITPINLFYVARKIKGAEVAIASVAGLLKECRVCPIDFDSLQTALTLSLNDYEDAAQLAGALAQGLDAIVTRDPKDFVGSPLPIFSPADFLNQLTAASDVEA